MLSITDLHVSVQGEEILHGVNLHIPRGEMHAMFGPNGSGKSVMMMTIMGYPEYEVLKGRIIVDGRDVTQMPVDERVKLGVGLSEQRPPVIKSVKLKDLIELILPENERQYHFDGGVPAGVNVERFLDRGINDGLSGGESKQVELFLLLLANPKLLILDEPDSGVDPEHLKQVGRLINASLRQKTPDEHVQNSRPCANRKAGLISTHSSAILEYVHVDKAHLMMDGEIKCSGAPALMMNHIKEQGYEHCVNCLS